MPNYFQKGPRLKLGTLKTSSDFSTFCLCIILAFKRHFLETCRPSNTDLMQNTNSNCGGGCRDARTFATSLALSIPLENVWFLGLFLQFSVSKDFVHQKYYLKYIFLSFSRDLQVTLFGFPFARMLNPNFGSIRCVVTNVQRSYLVALTD